MTRIVRLKRLTIRKVVQKMKSPITSPILISAALHQKSVYYATFGTAGHSVPKVYRDRRGRSHKEETFQL